MGDQHAAIIEQAVRQTARLETVLNNLNCQIHVTRPETGEILFINKTMRRDLGLLDRDIEGVTCWTLLGQNQGKKCPCCPYDELLRSPDSNCEWDSNDPFTGREYHNTSFLVDWDDGTQVYMCQTNEITEMRQILASLEAQIARQQLQSRLTLEAGQHTHTETMIQALLAPLAEHMNIDRAFVLHEADPEAPLKLVAEWQAPAIASIHDALSDLQLSDLREEFSPARSQSAMVFDTPDLLPSELAKLGKEKQLHSLLVLPLRTESGLWGMLCLGTRKQTRVWDASDFAMLHTICGIVTSALRRIHAEQHRLETQEQLKEAIVTAEKASGAKSDFLSRMSHEIRTPMNVIIGMCRMALRSDDPAKVRHSLNQIDTSAKHLLGLINDILDVSKIEANKFELHMEAFDLEHMLMGVSNNVMIRAEERKQNIQILLARGMPQRFIGDEMRLGQVVTNLFTNAIKFSPDGGNIVLSMRELSREGNRCKLEARVRDHGIGMSPEQLSRLFTSFEQADGSIARKYGGTGLGLAICKSIVDMMDGEISVESELGRGSTFIFTVEMDVAPDIAEEAHGQARAPLNLRVLVIDDEPAACEYFASIVQGFGITCDQACSGKEALRMLKDFNAYDFVFVDWRMPEMDGVETVRTMRSLLGEHVMVIMVSSADLNEIKEEASSAGVHYFITKPLFSSDLYNFISNILGMSGQQLQAKQEHVLTNVPDLRAFRVLLAEDMEFNREVALAMLEETGCMADEAENGKQAVEMFARDPMRYGCIFMDMQMPEMDGLAATRAIRALDHPWAQKVPIIAMTANVFQDDVESCLAAGMDDHIGKPIVDHTLYEKLAFYLHANATRAVAVAPKEMPAQDTVANFLPYVNIELGLARLRGNKKLFATLLGSFQRNSKYTEMREQIDKKLLDQAAQSAHALKGIAANIELGEVYRLIVTVEAALKGAALPPQTLLEELDDAYTRTLELLPRVTAFLSQENA